MKSKPLTSMMQAANLIIIPEVLTIDSSIIGSIADDLMWFLVETTSPPWEKILLAQGSALLIYDLHDLDLKKFLTGLICCFLVSTNA